MRHSTYVGIDTHKDTNAICALDPATGDIHEATLAGEADLVIEWIGTLVKEGELIEPVLCVYEAGPTGFGLYRALEGAGIECVVAAPSKLPQRTDRVKTDKRDALWLAQQLQAGAVHAVWVPPANLEALRSLVALRSSRVRALAKAKQRLRSFMLKHGVRRPDGRRGWGPSFLAWANSVELPEPADDYVFHELVDEVAGNARTLQATEARMAETIAADPELSALTGALEALPGIGPVLSATLVARVGDASRFPRLDAFPAYIGLCPREASSGKTVRRGGMAKAGDATLRALLMQAATCVLRPLRRHVAAPAGTPAWLAEEAEAFRERLRKRRSALTKRGKPANKVKGALARELAMKALSVMQRVQSEMMAGDALA